MQPDPSSITKRLEGVRADLAREREALRILDEQVAHVADVAADLEVRAVVAGTPLADREHQVAAGDVRRTRRQRDEVAARVAELAAEQDELLERLFEVGSAPSERGGSA